MQNPIRYTPKRIKLHQLKKILMGACPQNPLAIDDMQISKFGKKFLLAPYQILGTPL